VVSVVAWRHTFLSTTQAGHEHGVRDDAEQQSAEHGGQRDGQGQTSGDLDAGAEQQHDRGDEYPATGDAHDGGDGADEGPGEHADDDGGWGEGDVVQGMPAWLPISATAMPTRSTARTR
jgi:hypothetical protein